MKRTVLEYIWSLNDGGAETLVKDYALLLDEDRFDVRVLAVRPFPNTANTRILREKNVRVDYIYPQWNILTLAFNKFFGKYYRPWRIKRYIQKTGVSVVHIHLQQLKEFVPISKDLQDVRLLYTCHNLPETMFSGPHASERKAAEYLIKHNDLRLIALHDHMRDELNEMFGVDNTAVIRNGIQMDRFRNVPESRESIRKAEKLPENAFIVGHIGRFNRLKNHAFLLDVFAKVYKRNPNAFLLLVGSGELRSAIEASLEEKGLSESVRILSNRTDVPRLLKAMDVFVFPSLHEGLGIVLIEAQAAGLRCIVSDSVPREAFRTPLAVPASLKESADCWADLILDNSIQGPYGEGLDDYDMRREIKRMEVLYLGE